MLLLLGGTSEGPLLISGRLVEQERWRDRSRCTILSPEVRGIDGAPRGRQFRHVHICRVGGGGRLHRADGVQTSATGKVLLLAPDQNGQKMNRGKTFSCLLRLFFKNAARLGQEPRLIQVNARREGPRAHRGDPWPLGVWLVMWKKGRGGDLQDDGNWKEYVDDFK